MSYTDTYFGAEEKLGGGRNNVTSLIFLSSLFYYIFKNGPKNLITVESPKTGSTYLSEDSRYGFVTLTPPPPIMEFHKTNFDRKPLFICIFFLQSYISNLYTSLNTSKSIFTPVMIMERYTSAPLFEQLTCRPETFT